MNRLNTLGDMSEQVVFSRLYHCVYALHDHLAMCTGEGALRLGAVWRDCRGPPLRVRSKSLGEADHVLVPIALPPNLNLSNFVNKLKVTNSRLLRRAFADKVKQVDRKHVF